MAEAFPLTVNGTFGVRIESFCGAQGSVAGEAGVFIGSIRYATVARTITHGHHALPKFLGGNASQQLSRLDSLC